MDKKKRFLKAYVRSIGEEEGMLVGAIGSTDDVDRYGEIIDQESWDLKNFRKNPVLLWAHNLTLGEDRPPIGKLTKITVDDVNGKKQLVFNAQFDMADPFAADIFRKYKEGFLNAFSVGFIAKIIQRVDEDGKTLDHPVLRDNELLEMSSVPVPANPKALNELRSRSFKTKSWDKLMKEVEEEEDEEDEGKIKSTEEIKGHLNKMNSTYKSMQEADESEMPDLLKKMKGHAQDMSKTCTDMMSDMDEEKTNPKTAITSINRLSDPPKAENRSGSDSDPKKTQQGGMSPKLAAVIRATTRSLQAALEEHNKSMRQ